MAIDMPNSAHGEMVRMRIAIFALVRPPIAQFLALLWLSVTQYQAKREETGL